MCELCGKLVKWLVSHEKPPFNVNGLLTVHKRRYLEIDLLYYNIDVLCVQETHERCREGEFRYETY